MNRKSRMSRKNRKARKDKVWGGDDLHLHAARAPHPKNLAPPFENEKSKIKFPKFIFNFWKMFLNFREKVINRIDHLSQNKLDSAVAMVLALIIIMLVIGACRP